MRSLPRLLLLLLLVFPATLLLRGGPGGSLAVAQDLTEDEETVEDSIIEDEDDEAEVEEDEPTDLAEDKEEEDVSGEPEASPSADTTILFVKGEDIFQEKIVFFFFFLRQQGGQDQLLSSVFNIWRFPEDFQWKVKGFSSLSSRQCVKPSQLMLFQFQFECLFPLGIVNPLSVWNMNLTSVHGNVFQDAVFNQTVTIIEREDGLDGETIFMYMFLAGLGLLLVVGLHQLLESRKRKRPIQKVETGTSSQNDVDMSWIPQETLNQINKASPRRLPRKRAQKRSVGSDE
uniref:Translocon-associated protein subunit alpha n=1 Tax=Sus scrofa TaxID=9823 RepID=A0A8D1HSQ6_PIG